MEGCNREGAELVTSPSLGGLHRLPFVRKGLFVVDGAVRFHAQVIHDIIMCYDDPLTTSLTTVVYDNSCRFYAFSVLKGTCVDIREILIASRWALLRKEDTSGVIPFWHNMVPHNTTSLKKENRAGGPKLVTDSGRVRLFGRAWFMDMLTFRR